MPNRFGKNIDAKNSIELMKDLMDIFSSSEKPSSYFAAGIGIVTG